MNNSKKIGVLTFHSSENYGSVLQAWALCKKIDNILGEGSAEIIDYSNENQRNLYAIFLKNNSVKNIVKNARALLNYSQLKTRKDNFRNFINNTLPLSKEKYTSENDLKNYSANYNLIVCGSDQIWNPQSQDFSLSFFGVDFDCKKVAYAPSIRNASINDFEPYAKEIKNAVSNFTYLSLREKASIPVFEKIVNKNIDCVCDPTLLLTKDDFDTICSNNELPKDYIFYYSIDYNSQSVEMVKAISKSLNKPVLVIFSTNKTYNVYFKGFTIVKNNAVEDFVNLVKNASLVLSTSFHGVALSVIYRKNFFALKANNYTDSRINDLLSAINLSDRYIDYNDYESVNLNQPVNYDEKAISEFVNYSTNYLIRCLND